MTDILILSKDGSCPECKAPKDKFSPVLGGQEVCKKCGYTRTVV